MARRSIRTRADSLLVAILVIGVAATVFPASGTAASGPPTTTAPWPKLYGNQRLLSDTTWIPARVYWTSSDPSGIQCTESQDMFGGVYSSTGVTCPSGAPTTFSTWTLEQPTAGQTFAPTRVDATNIFNVTSPWVYGLFTANATFICPIWRQ